MVCYVTYKIDARFVVKVEADTVEDALKEAESEYMDADFGVARDIDGEPIIIENEHGDFIFEK